ncbi:MAG: PcfJ domain-containing protein [Chthoniobacterales bacterium]
MSILSHLPTIEAAELRLAADWGCRPRISFALFTDMAAQLPCETEGGWGRLLRQTETLLRLGAREYRLLRSVQQTRRHYYRRWRELADLENFDPTHEDAVAADILFPPVPIPGIEEIQPIDSAAALVAEARAMGHCVLSYAEQVAEGDAYLYRVMNPQRATLLVGFCGAGWHLKELAGVRNQPVSRETENLVESWLRSARHQQSRQFV